MDRISVFWGNFMLLARKHCFLPVVWFLWSVSKYGASTIW